MLKKMLLIAAGLFLLMPIQAQNTEKTAETTKKSDYVFARVYRAEKNPAVYINPLKAQKLLEEREKLVAGLDALRKKMIRENQDFAKLQASFDSCLKKLGTGIAAKDSVQTIQRRLRSLDLEAKELPKKIAEKEKQLAAAREQVKSSDAEKASEGFKTAEKLQKEIASLKKTASTIPARRAAQEKDLRETMRRVIRMEMRTEVKQMEEIADQMTLIIESTEEAKKINRDLKAIDAELDKLLKK